MSRSHVRSSRVLFPFRSVSPFSRNLHMTSTLHPAFVCLKRTAPLTMALRYISRPPITSSRAVEDAVLLVPHAVWPNAPNRR